MERKIENYIISHSSDEDPVLKELYRQTHIRFVNPNMASGNLQGRFLEMISKMISPDNILEIGTFTGYSAICLARGLRPGGRLITIELNDELVSFSNDFFRKADLSGSIEQLTGRAQDVIPGLNIKFDLVFIDGDKREYCEYFRAVKKKVKSGGFIIADNVLWGGKALDESTKDQQTRGIIEFNEMIKSEPGIENVILPLRDGIMVIRII
ncbi:MAG: O-methyltransferase [Bacteroidales bacterium]